MVSQSFFTCSGIFAHLKMFTHCIKFVKGCVFNVEFKTAPSDNITNCIIVTQLSYKMLYMLQVAHCYCCSVTLKQLYIKCTHT
jgi:hypothetical protein